MVKKKKHLEKKKFKVWLMVWKWLSSWGSKLQNMHKFSKRKNKNIWKVLKRKTHGPFFGNKPEMSSGFGPFALTESFYVFVVKLKLVLVFYKTGSWRSSFKDSQLYRFEFQQDKLGWTRFFKNLKRAEFEHSVRILPEKSSTSYETKPSYDRDKVKQNLESMALFPRAAETTCN